jgi:transcription initiation factor IIE alpha subunit
MTFIEQIEVLDRLHHLIKRKATGTPEQLAQKFNVSKRTVKNLLKILRDRDIPIYYCRNEQTYSYECDVDVYFFYIKIHKKTLRNVKRIKYHI